MVDFFVENFVLIFNFNDRRANRWERAAQTKASTFFEDLQHAAVTNAFTAS